MASGPQVTATFTANTSAYVSGVQRAAAATQQFQAATGQATQSLSTMKLAAGTALGGLAVQGINKTVGAIKSLIGGSFQAAARVEELNVAMEAIGTSTGKGGDAIRQAAKDIKANGIEMATAQQIAIQFAQANLKMADASKISRVAQDLAVVAGLNSTETTQRLTTAIVTGNSELLRAAGIAQTASMAYEVYGKEIGKSAQNLTAQEKQQAMVNMIMKEGEKVAGTYEASMTSAGKVMRSFPRIINDLQVSIGSVLSAAFGPLIIAAYNLLKSFSKLLEEGGAFYPVLQTMKDIFIQMVQPVTDFATRFAQMLQNKELMSEIAAKLQTTLTVVKELAPAIAILVAGYAAMRLTPAILGGVKRAIEAVKAAQWLWNAAAYANPYVAVAAAIVAALAIIAAAFKFTYDRSHELRKAWDSFIETAKKLAAIVMDTLVSAIRSFNGESDKTQKKTMSFQEALKMVVDVLSKMFTFEIKMAIMRLQALVAVIKIIIKMWEIGFRVFTMVGNIIRHYVSDAFNALMDKLGPVGEKIKETVGQIKKFFSDLPANIKTFVNQARPMLEGWINSFIDGINRLIDAYNAIPFVGDVTHVGRFEFGDLSAVEGIDDHYVRGGLLGDLTTKKPKKEEPPGGLPPADTEGQKAQKVAEMMKEAAQVFIDAIKRMGDAYKGLVSLTEQPFGEQSQIEKAFGKDSDIDSVIGMYNQLKATVTEFYEAEASANAANADDIRNTEALKVLYLQRATEEIIDMMRKRNQAMKDIQTAQEEADKKISAINEKYDALDKQAAADIKSLEDKWAATIKAIEAQLAQATEAFNKENAVLQSLISERDQFTKQIVDGFRSFVNNLSMTDDELSGGGGFRAALESRLQAIREFNTNIQDLLKRGLDPTLVRQFIEAGPAQAGQMVADLVAGSDDNLAAINQTQKDLSAETAAFAQVASKQYYDAAVAQQQAIVEPMKAWMEFSAQALATAQMQRDQEVAAAQAHAERLKSDRAKEIKEAEDARDAEVKRLTTLIEELSGKIDQKAKEVQKYFTDLQATWPKEMENLGAMAMDSLAKGLASKVKLIRETANMLAGEIRAAIARALEMHSPSRVMISLGEDIAEGIAIGMQNGARSVMAAADGLAAATMPDMNATISGVSAGGKPVVVQPGAVQISFSGSLDEMSASQIQSIVDESLMRLAREIRRT